MRHTRDVKSPSIRDVLNDLAANLPDSPPEGLSPSFAPDFTDIAQWIALDSDVLSLYKAHLDARAEYLNTLVAHGADSPLSEIAADRSDSLWCALEARLYELRMDRTAQARKALAQKLENEAARTRNIAAQQADREARTAQNVALRTRQTEEKQRRSHLFFFWYWCQFVIGARMEHPLPCPSLSRTFAAA
ncbi:MAG: hypothetical protein H6862_05225 [Rhodospirillales bacterium]|nr:hypothetical protein [Rhodospirillales bacterium]